MAKLPVSVRFARHVDTSAGPLACHPWTGATYKDMGGRRRGKMRVGARTMNAQRVALALNLGAETDDEVAALPSLIEAAHTCDNGICANRAHIEAKSHQENVAEYCAKHGGIKARTGQRKQEIGAAA